MRHASIGLTAIGLLILLGTATAAAQTIITVGKGFVLPAGVMVDAKGDVFVTDNSAVKEIAAGSNSVTTLIAGAPPPEGIALDRSGNAFFYDLNGRIFEAPAAGGYATVQQVASGFTALVGLAIDGAGNLFVADAGASYGEGTLHELTAASGYTQSLALAGSYGRLGPIALDAQGNLFVLEPNFPNPGVLDELTAAGGYASVAPVASGFEIPVGIAADVSGNLFITESGQPTVKEVLAASGYKTILTLGTGLTSQSGLSTPSGLAVDASENIFVADFNSGAIVEFPAANGYSTATFYGLGLHRPIGVALDAAGNIFIADDDRGGIAELTAASNYATLEVVANNTVSTPAQVAMDSHGNLIVADAADNAIKEILAAGGYTSIREIACCIPYPIGLVLDSSDNIFVSFDGGMEEIFAAGGYTTARPMPFPGGDGIAIDGAGNLFVTDTGGGAILELTAASGYSTQTTLYSNSPYFYPDTIAVDQADNVFFTVSGNSNVLKLSAADNYATLTAVGSGYNGPDGLAVDRNGNVYIADSGNNVVKEVLAAASPLQAAILPGARSVQLGSPATVFATMINSGSTAFSGCSIALPDPSPAGLTLTYQTTDPATNTPTGTPNTPVSLAGGNGMQSFLLSFQGTSAFSVLNLAPVFGCTGAEPAALDPGVDTLDLTVSSMPLADIIAVVATPTGNGVLTVPVGGDAAFAIATTNLGAEVPLDLELLSLTQFAIADPTICQTNSTTGQCLAPPSAGGLQVDLPTGTTATFSVFVHATGAIPFNPAGTRLFVEFFDTVGVRGLTSVAVETE